MLRQQGFTLLELLAVLVVIGIAVTVLATGLSRGMASVRERQVLADLVQGLRQAHALAVTERHAVTMVFDLSRLCYRLEHRPERCLPDGYQLTVQSAAEASAGHPSFLFLGDGSSSGGNLLVRSPLRESRIDVNWLTGNVSVAQP